MPPSLAEIQRALAARVLGGDDRTIENWIRVPAGVDIAARLAIYSDGYPARVMEALREAFPATANILGDGSLAALTERYVQHLPAALRNLNAIGAGLPEFLKTDALNDALPFLADLARLEWAVVECFHGEPAGPLDPSRCAGWSEDDWAAARVELQPQLTLVRSAWPVRALRDTRNLDRSAISVDLADRADRALVYRRGFDVVVESLDEVEADALEGFRAGKTLAEAVGRLAETGAAADAVTRLFTRWSSLGLVVSCRRAPPAPAGTPGEFR